MRTVADRWGVEPTYINHRKQLTSAPQATIEHLVARLSRGRTQPPESDVLVIRAGSDLALNEPGEVVLEDGSTLGETNKVSADLPIGYHTIHGDGRSRRLIVAPPTCYLPDDLYSWGLSAQLYSVRSKRSWGMGDLGDLERLAFWSRDLGAGLLMVNPLSSVIPAKPQEASPYFPSSRLFLNPLYLNIEDISGANLLPDTELLSIEGRGLNDVRLIDRDTVFDLKMRALNAIWDRVSDAVDLASYETERGESLTHFATFCVLAESFSEPWQRWPLEFRRPDGPAVERFRQEHLQRVRFHEWLQMLLDEQLVRATQAVGLVTDFAVGVDPAGADAWMWQDYFLTDTSVGAPPDKFNTQGQDWSTPPLDPWSLREGAYEPFIQTLRATMRRSRGLRIDHVMGLARLYCIPKGSSPAQGAFIRYPVDELMAIIALESQRAGAFVVGEDLGTVERSLRAKMTDQQMLSYRLVIFSGFRASRYPRMTFAAVSTHDLPTIAGLWSGSDLIEQSERGLSPNEPATSAMISSIRKGLKLKGQSIGSVIDRMHSWLAERDSCVAVVSLEDLLGEPSRVNMPSTHLRRPNWSMSLPSTLEDLTEDPRAVRLSDQMRARCGPMPR